jgi:hypothetical protein
MKAIHPGRLIFRLTFPARPRIPASRPLESEPVVTNDPQNYAPQTGWVVIPFGQSL